MSDVYQAPSRRGYATRPILSVDRRQGLGKTRAGGAVRACSGPAIIFRAIREPNSKAGKKMPIPDRVGLRALPSRTVVVMFLRGAGPRLSDGRGARRRARLKFVEKRGLGKKSARQNRHRRCRTPTDSLTLRNIVDNRTRNIPSQRSAASGARQCPHVGPKWAKKGSTRLLQAHRS